MESIPMVCYPTGTMNSLVDKLAKMRNHSNSTEEFSDMTREFEKAVMSLKEDFLDKLAVPKVCMKQVRELVFEIEDWIDQKPQSDLLDPSDMEQIKNFMTEIEEARERFTWYYDLLERMPDLAVDAPSNINPRLPVEEKYCHGLLDGPRDELVKHLTDEKEEMRKVVSVVGMEGLGKTTLAKEIYSELQLHWQFECQAFVSVGRRTSMMEILNDILHQVKPGSNISLDVQRVITELRKYLGTKRYFIIVNGIWSTWAWKVINCALPNNRGSRVLTTTCTIDIGRSCSSYPSDLVYQMEALNMENSRILFLSKTITLQEEEKWAGFEEDSCYMLKMGDGMPLAIIVAAGLLLAKKSEAVAELKMLGGSIHSSLKQYSPSEGMNKILQMSYADLSHPLRSCFLCLSLFPENYTIRKDRLILIWVAKGFISKIDKEFSWLTGERYFNELISRRLIQPVFNHTDDQAVGCTVHTLILDFIRSLSREENFAMTAAELISGPFPCDTIRQFSLDCRNEDEADTLSISSMHLSSMRSLTVFGDVEGKLCHPNSPGDDERISDPQRLPSVSKHGISINILSAFKLLRVLDLEDAKNLKNHHLEGIGRLVLLRFLGLAGTGINELPEDIGKLEQLETLDLGWNGLTTFPASATKLQKLRYLLLKVDATNIWEMPELEEAGILVQNSSSLGKVVELLRKSERLRRLTVFMQTSVPTETDHMSFLEEVVKSKLQFLHLDYNSYYTDMIPLLLDSWEKVTAPLETKFEPRRFFLRIDYLYPSRVLPNIGSLASLTHLDITVYEATAEEFLVLEALTNLVILAFRAYDFHARGSFIIKGGIFPFLKVFWFRIDRSWMGLEFEEGAMPQLQRLGRGFRVISRRGEEYSDIGIERLTCLTRVRATIYCMHATVLEVEDAEASIRVSVSEIATKPRLELSREEASLMKGRQTLVSPFDRRQVYEESRSIRQLADDDQIREEEGQHSLTSKKQVSEKKVEKWKLNRNRSSLYEKMKRRLTGRPKLSEKSNKHESKSIIEDEDQISFPSDPKDEGQVRKDKGKHPVPFNKTSIREGRDTSYRGDCLNTKGGTKSNNSLAPRRSI